MAPEPPLEDFDREVQWPDPATELRNALGMIWERTHPDVIPDTPDGPFTRDP